MDAEHEYRLERVKVIVKHVAWAMVALAVVTCTAATDLLDPSSGRDRISGGAQQVDEDHE